jgi:hypothetical protein
MASECILLAMGLWDNTGYVRCSDVPRIVAALAEVFAIDDRAPTDRPEPRQPGRFEPMQHGGGKALASPLWAVSLVRGADWTAIKTAPFELLCERARRRKRPRLAELARRLQTDAFQINVYDGDSTILIEANARGKSRVSGFNASGDEEMFHAEEIDGDFEAQFELIEAIPEECVRALEHVPDEQPFYLARALLGIKRLEVWDREVSNSPTPSPRTTEIFFR